MMKEISAVKMSSVLFLVMIILVFPDASFGEPRAQTVLLMCGNQLMHNTTVSVPNFVTTMENISEQMRNSGFGVAISGSGPDSSYGLAQCYRDLSLLDCVLCYAEARTVLPQCFPFSGGRVFLDGCFMRTENYSFFEEFKGPQDRAVCGNKTTKDSTFDQLARQAVLNAVIDAPSNNGTARAELRDSSNVKQSVYVLAECWRSLNAYSCRACLESVSRSILGCLPSNEGRALNTGCFMRYSNTNFLNPVHEAGSYGASATLPFPMAKRGCKDKCGNNVTIPYPFGIGSDCALHESYTVECKRKTANVQENFLTPFLKINGNDYEVLEVSLMDQTVTVTSPPGNISSCYGKSDPSVPTSSGNGTYGSDNLDGAPFFYSKEHNRLTLLGCGNALLSQNQAVLSGCTSTCFVTSSEASGCFGIDCCQADIPFNLKQYWVNFTATETSNNSSRCSVAILVDRKWIPENKLFLPVVWSWTIPNPTVTDAILGCSRKTSILEVESGNISNYGCECKAFGPLTWFYEINPYLNGACDHAVSAINGTRKNTKAAIIGKSGDA